MQNLAMREQVVEDGEQQLAFSATGSEYFRIWIVNLLLSIVTLGIYSAWAKVRRNQYFYASTRLAGSSFEYHGNPGAILKGRVLAVALLAGYHFAFSVSATAGFVMMGVMALVMPVLTWKSLQFKLHNASYRGIRFGFDGSLGEAYAHYLLLPLLFGTGLLAPLAHNRIKRFQHTESRFGASHFSYDASALSFYKAYGIMFGLFLVFAFGAGIVAALLGVTAENAVYAPLVVYLLMLSVMPLFFSMIQNIIWNHTRLGEHEFRCNLKWGPLCWIYVTNLLGIVCTLGLFIPFAKVRAMKYRVEAMSMLVNGSLDHFVAGEQSQVSATGEGVADFLDLDLSL
ncbi:MAG TPA: YjgN family protein [Pseudoduganella sp.]